MFLFSFSLFKNLLRCHSQFESIINRSIERIQLFPIHLLLSSLFICIVFFFSSLPSLSFLPLFSFSIFLFVFHLPLLFLFLFLFLFLHNISWITLTSSHYHIREGSSSHKKLAFPCFIFIFSILCFPSIFSIRCVLSSSSSTGINIQFGLFDLLNVFLHIEYNSKIHDITRLFLIRDMIQLCDSSPFPVIFLILLLILWSLGTSVLSFRLIYLVFARMSMS